MKDGLLVVCYQLSIIGLQLPFPHRTVFDLVHDCAIATLGYDNHAWWIHGYNSLCDDTMHMKSNPCLSCGGPE